MVLIPNSMMPNNITTVLTLFTYSKQPKGIDLTSQNESIFNQKHAWLWFAMSESAGDVFIYG